MIKEAGEVFLWDRELCSLEQEMEIFGHWAQTAQTAMNVNFNIQKPALSMISGEHVYPGTLALGLELSHGSNFFKG
jgi:hypothetical protein